MIRTLTLATALITLLFALVLSFNVVRLIGGVT